MELLETDANAQLLDDDPEYRQLADKHREYELQLEQIAHRRPFTQQDWFEANVVKKRKLMVKDQMQSLARLAASAPARAG